MSNTKNRANNSRVVYFAYILLALAGISTSMYKLFDREPELAIKSVLIMLAGVVIVALVSVLIKKSEGDLLKVARILLYALTFFMLFCLFSLMSGMPEHFYCGPLNKIIGITDCDSENEIKKEISNDPSEINKSTNEIDTRGTKTKKQEIKNNCKHDKYSYLIKTKTNKHTDGGTNDKIEIRLYGKSEFTKWIHLDNKKSNDFEKGESNIFTFDSKNKIEELTKAELRISKLASNKTKHVDDIFLEKIQIQESLCNLKSEFKIVNIWIGDGRGKNKKAMIREIPISWKK